MTDKPRIVFEDDRGKAVPGHIERPEDSEEQILVPDMVGGRPVMRVMGQGKKHPDDELWEGERERHQQASAGVAPTLRKNNRGDHQIPGQPLPERGREREAGNAALQIQKNREAMRQVETLPAWEPDEQDLAADEPLEPMADSPDWKPELRRAPPEGSELINGLTSAGYPYGGENFMHVRTLEWSELEILARASEQDSTEHVMKALDRTTDIPVQMLSIPDFYQLLYWQRINSYKEMQYIMPWRCDEPTGVPGGQCNQENHSPLGRSNLSVTHLDELGFETMPEGLDWPRAYLLPEMTALLRRNTYKEALEVAEAALRNADLTQDDRRAANAEYLLIKNRMLRTESYLKNVTRTPASLTPDLVEVLKWVKVGKTLREKRDFMRSQKSLDLYQKAQRMERQFTYGIHEMANVNCGKCGASRGFRIRVDVPTFLS